MLDASQMTVRSRDNYPIAFFTKPLDEFELAFMGDTLAMAGIDAMDLALRPKGRVEPERIMDDLPKVMEMGKSYHLKTEMMVTSITDPTEASVSNVLKVAAEHGIKHYRLGYYDYDLKKGIVNSLNGIKSKLDILSRLNLEAGIQGGFQNHAGRRVGAPLWDIWHLIKDLPVKAMSSQFDVRHAVAEGSSSWILAMHLMGKNIGSLAIKDFRWDVSGRVPKITDVPLGEGIVDFDLYFRTLKELNIIAPFTLHVEYPFFDPKEESLSLLEKQKIMVKKIRKDVNFIRSHLTRFQLV